jgi:hypothetical protein
VIAILGILGSAWPFLLAGGAALFALFTHLNATSKIAVAGQQVAQAQATVAQAQTQVAQTNDAVAQANATAAQAGAESLKEKVNVTNDVAALPPGAAADELRDGWTKD